MLRIYIIADWRESCAETDGRTSANYRVASLVINIIATHIAALIIKSKAH